MSSTVEATATAAAATAPTELVDAAGVRFAYRRLGASDGVPRVLLQHFTGTIDSWDSRVVGGFGCDDPPQSRLSSRSAYVRPYRP